MLRGAALGLLFFEGAGVYRGNIAGYKTFARWFGFLMALTAFGSTATSASVSAPQVLRTPGQESPVHIAPDDLVILGGVGFALTDRVVYEAVGAGPPVQEHPQIPKSSGALAGLAQVIEVGDPPYSLTARLPDAIQPDRIYRLWVVNARGEWSAPITVNDPRPMWVTPGYVYASADPARLGRYLRIVGRNLRAAQGHPLQVRLEGPATYVLSLESASGNLPSLQDYVVDAALPARLLPGSYTVGVSRGDRVWVPVEGQRLEVEADPEPLPRFAIDDPRFGDCRAGDGNLDNACFKEAIAAAQRRGGGIVVVPPGVWDLSARDSLILPRNVHLSGPASRDGTIIRHDTKVARATALFTVTGNNSITNVTFKDADTFTSADESRPIIQLGEPAAAPDAVTDIVISDNDFQRVGRAIEDSGRPILRLMVTHNRLSAYDRALQLPGNHFGITAPYRIDDSVVRWNRFVPGSFIDIRAHQGTIASELGASHRLDFSDNTAAGADTEGLQDATDLRGFRAAFFWNLNGNQELLLVSANTIECSGDKAGDGEAIAFDGNGDTFAFNGAQRVIAAAATTITVRDVLESEQGGRVVDRATFYRGHWVQVMDGPGAGQVRKIQSYVEDRAARSVTFHVAPAWDIPPGEASRVVVGREYWQVYALANHIEHGKPPCQQSNMNGPDGGAIGMWAPSADTIIASNYQHETSGIGFLGAYSVRAPSCPECNNTAAFQTALEIRDNVVDGEYDWASDCSRSGIMGALSVSPTPESPPPLVGIGISIAHNTIAHADGFRGGAVDLTATWYLGPPPGGWQLLQSVLIQHNDLQDIDGPPPRAACRFGQTQRIAVRQDGKDNIRNTVLYANRCKHISSPLLDGGKNTLRLCTKAGAENCECMPASK